MMKNLFICIMGIDGSGKTTLTYNLIKRLGSQENVEYRWCKFESSFFKLLIKIKNLFIREKNWKKNYDKSLKLKKNLFNSKIMKFLYEKYVIFSYTLQIFYQIRVPLRMGKTIFCDRYIYDTLVDLAYDLDYDDRKIVEKLSILNQLSPSPNMIFFVDIPIDVAFKRKNDVPSLEFLKQKNEYYEKINNHLLDSDHFAILDGKLSPDDLENEVMCYLKNLI